MQPGPYLKSERLHTVADRARTTDRARWAVKCRERTVASRLDPGATKPLDFSAHEYVVIIKECAPTSVTQAGGQPGRVDTVSEQHGGQHSVERHLRQAASEELLQCVEQRDAVWRERHVVGSWHLDRFRSLDVVNQIAGSRSWSTVRVIDDERWRSDRAQHLTKIDIEGAAKSPHPLAWRTRQSKRAL